MPGRSGCAQTRERTQPPQGVPQTPPIIQVEIRPAMPLSPKEVAAFKRVAARVWQTMQQQGHATPPEEPTP